MPFFRTSRPRDVSLLMRPLRSSKNDGREGSPDVLHRLKPRRFQHWAIQVGDYIYEIIKLAKEDIRAGKGPKYQKRITRAKDWQTEWSTSARKYGVWRTTCSDDEVSTRAQVAWNYILEEKYNAFRRNCQNFASLLFALIHQSEYKEEWNRFPSPIGRRFVPDVRKVIQPILTAIKVQDASPRMIPLYISRSYLRAVEQVFEDHGVFSPENYKEAKRKGREALKEAKRRNNMFRRLIA